MIRFYAPEIESTGVLPEVESAHCCRVLRLAEGDEIQVVDGKGCAYRCRITRAHTKATEVEVVEKIEENKHWLPRITLAVAATKNADRIEWLAEKAVEIGVDKFVILDCHNNVRHVMKRERIEKIMISAMKQSMKSRMPELVEMIKLHHFIASDVSAKKYMGYCDSNTERKEFACDYDGESDLTILIGPEGDFTPEEVKMAIEAGYTPVTFGATRLRTETAALYALAAAHTLMTAHTTL